jgi:hypothetical protein
VTFWMMVFVGSLALAVVHVVRGRRMGHDARTIVADSRLLMLGLPLSVSLDHILSRSGHMGSVAVAGLASDAAQHAVVSISPKGPLMCCRTRCSG